MRISMRITLLFVNRAIQTLRPCIQCAPNNSNLTQPHLHVANIMLTIRYVRASLLPAHVLSREFKFPTRVPDFITMVILFHIVYKIALQAPA